ncbi:MAG: ACT domain-containing protein [Faecalibacterium sp.]|nr:ACT domain-containing protein [Ruminococcus sp.]MCM1391147.1 ACT domain-containing protein [Ruminococcus sp.]MCM1486235.1 ACT domain-containing protein [Faecalibacterium sp.]
MMKAIVTVTGKDTTGIIAKVCTHLADSQVNILDISQTVMQQYFTMTMLIDLENSEKSVTDLSEELAELGKTMGLVIRTQREDIFDLMYRV